MNSLRRILPRLLFAAGCLATLVAIFYAEERWRGDRAWARYLAESGTIESTDRRSLQPDSFPEEENFAEAPIFKRVLADFRAGVPDPDPFRWPAGRDPRLGYYDGNRATDFEKWRQYFEEAKWIEPGTLPAERAVLLALERYAPALREVHEAGTRPFSRFPEMTDEEIFSGMPYRWMLIHLSRLLPLKAEAEIALGQSAAACADLRDGFRVYSGFRSLPGGFYGALRGIMILQLESAVDEGLRADAWSDADLRGLQQSLEPIDLLADTRFSIDTARRRLTDLMVRFEGDLFMERLITQTSYTSLTDAGYWCREHFFPAGWMALNKVKLNQVVDAELSGLDVDAGVVLRRPHVRQTLDDLWRKWPTRTVYWPLPGLLFAEDGNYGQRIFQTARLRESVTALALMQFRHAKGRYPDRLDELVPDYLSRLPHGIAAGDPMHYREEKGGFLLWCKAIERGAEARPDEISPYDIDWRLPRPAMR